MSFYSTVIFIACVSLVHFLPNALVEAHANGCIGVQMFVNECKWLYRRANVCVGHANVCPAPCERLSIVAHSGGSDQAL